MPKLGQAAALKREANGRGSEYLEGLARGINVLTAFNRDRQSATLADLSKKLGLPRATVRRSLLTLKVLGYVGGDERQFWLTPKVLELANSFLLSSPIVTIFQPVCDRLAEEFKTGVSVATLDGNEVVFIVRSYPDHMFSGTRASVGARLPAYCTAHGRMLLAGLDKEQLAEFLRNLAPQQLTPHTRTSKKEIKERIDHAKTNGYVIASQEASLGYRSIAVPVKRFDGRIVASLSCNSRVELLTEKIMRSEILPRLLEESARLVLPSTA